MRIKPQIVVFDTADLSAESRFWAGALGRTEEDFHDWHMAMVEDEPWIGAQLPPSYVSPDWPDGTSPQHIRLDLWVEALESAHERVMSLGATVLKAAEDIDSGDNFRVYADPAGHPFCLCWGRGTASFKDPTGQAWEIAR